MILSAALKKTKGRPEFSCPLRGRTSGASSSGWALKKTKGRPEFSCPLRGRTSGASSSGWALWLASKSPRRRELLQQIGVRFDVLSFRAGARSDAETDETPLAGEAPDDYVRRVACAKAAHGRRLIAWRHLPERLVLAADTTLDVDGRIFGKPADAAAAQAMLAELSGRSHRVLTAVAIARRDCLECVVSVSEVSFRSLTAEEIRAYVLTGEPLDKAGAYGLQGRAAMFVERMHGSPSGVVGLPLCETTLLLRRLGYPI